MMQKGTRLMRLYATITQKSRNRPEEGRYREEDAPDPSQVRKDAVVALKRPTTSNRPTKIEV